MSSQNMSLALIRDQATADGTWVNDPFVGIVKNAKAGQSPGQGNKAKPSKCALVDPADPNAVIGACWFGGNFLKYEDKVVRISGKGTKVSLYNGNAEINVGKDASVEIVGDAPAQAGPQNAGQHQRHDDTRGGGGGQTPPVTRPAEDPIVRFHKELKKVALLWTHAYQYAADVEVKLGKILSPDMKQSLVSSLFITGKDRGLLEKPPAPRAVRAEEKPGVFNGFEPFVPPAPDPAAVAAAEERKRKEEEDRRRREEEERRKSHENLDEDVPF